MVKKVAARHSTHGKKADNITQDDTNDGDAPLRTNPPMPEEGPDKSDIKPLIVPKQLPKNTTSAPVLAVEMNQLVIYPARNKLPTARHGLPFQ